MREEGRWGRVRWEEGRVRWGEGRENMCTLTTRPKVITQLVRVIWPYYCDGSNTEGAVVKSIHHGHPYHSESEVTHCIQVTAGVGGGGGGGGQVGPYKV